jgi:SAM-dependent methyltransferase
MDLIKEFYGGLPRQGPGSDEITRQALGMLLDLPDCPSVLDVGCGSGMQTRVLAEETGGNVTALDVYSFFLHSLKQRDLQRNIQLVQGTMFNLPFSQESFDLIWSEGAIYFMGFSEGIQTWKPLLKPGGYLAVTELSFLTRRLPEAVGDFWAAEYPKASFIAQNILSIDEAGYEFVGCFTLPESVWWDLYYWACDDRCTQMLELYPDDKQVEEFVAGTRAEMDLYRRYAQSYGYVFYLMQKP